MDSPLLSLNKKISIRKAVVSVFLFSTILTAIVAISLQYYFGYSLAKDAAEDLYSSSASSITLQLRDIRERIPNVVNILIQNNVLEDPEKITEQRQLFSTVMQQNPLAYSVFLGHKDGSLHQLINLAISTINEENRITLGASPGDYWLHVRVKPDGNTIQRQYEYFDEDFNLINTRREETDYDPRNRAWYINAVNSNTSQATEPYLFASLQAPGITVSRGIANTGTVLGIDMTLSSISLLLNQQEFSDSGTLFLFSDDGEVTATNQNGIDLAVDDSLINIAKTPGLQERVLELDLEGEPYFIYVAPLAVIEENASFLGIIVPSEIVLGNFLSKLELSIVLTLSFLALLLPLSWFFASPILKPIKALTYQNDKVRKREFKQVRHIDTYIKEVDELSESMHSMVSSIQAHELAQINLMDSFIKLIADAIDDKSPYTGGHCSRVPELAFMLAEDASKSTLPPFDTFTLENEDQWREFRISAWLHDCGKITTPEHIVDKGSKLETIYNRIHEVRMRFEVLWRDAEIHYLKQLQTTPDQEESLTLDLEESLQNLQDDFTFIAACNVGGEFFDQAQIDRLFSISKQTWQRNFDDRIGLSPAEELRIPDNTISLPVTEQLLSNKPEHIIPRVHSTKYSPELGIKMDVPEHLYNLGEIYNLSITRGTLNTEDRFKINEHMISTIKMLEALPFPEELANVPRYASTHHETIKGSGYPRKLTGDDLSIPERILAIADIFEALTASDRPYKKAKSVSSSLDILYQMALDRHVDMDCFRLFVQNKVYLKYAKEYLKPEQINEVDESKYIV